MRQESYFQMDNTEGYTAEMLTELNRRFESQVTEDMDEDYRQYLAERIQHDYDTELANQ